MTDTFGYEGKRVVVTGAASGIGRATAEVLVSLGAEVDALDVQPIVELHGVAGRHHVDLSDPSSIDAVVSASLAGPVDALFNCAGIPGTAPADVVIKVNFCGTRLLTERLVSQMPAGSAVCCIGTTSALLWLHHLELIEEFAAIETFDGAATWLDSSLDRIGYPYDFAKEAVVAYVATRSVTLNPAGIRINCINPGGTRTASTPDFGKVVKAKEFGAEMLANYPKLMGRMAKPVEQAWPMVFLNSPLASFVTGAALNVDAGFTSGLVTGQFDPVVAKAMRWPGVTG
jgi:NAD(P)-dependent dehydrogenase (short-subunit alcohol dehydrogenase family)